MKNRSLQIRLIVMNFLEFAVWGAYLTCMSRYLASHNMGAHIGWFYAIQGVVSLFMPALMGIVADRWIPAQKLLSICHLLAGLFMGAAGAYALSAGAVQFAPLFTLYTISVAFFMPTIALTNSVAFNALVKAGMDTVKDFPPIRVFGTVGFIAAMWAVDLLSFLEPSHTVTLSFLHSKEALEAANQYLVSFQDTPYQFVISGGLSLILAAYALSLPACDIKKVEGKVSLVDALGLRAFSLFKQKKMALFFIFSMLLGMCLQVTNSYANPFLGSFEAMQVFSSTFAVQHSNMLISISQICEAVCILLIPFFLKRFGIKNVMLMAMFAWVLRFAFFGIGDPGSGLVFFILSCIVYGFAFDFFNISGALYVDQETSPEMRSSAQGLFMMMTNGVGATIGVLGAQAIVSKWVPAVKWEEFGVGQDEAGKYLWLEFWDKIKEIATPSEDLIANLHMIAERANEVWAGWQVAWYIFAGFALVVAISFWIFFPKTPVNKNLEVKH